MIGLTDPRRSIRASCCSRGRLNRASMAMSATSKREMSRRSENALYLDLVLARTPMLVYSGVTDDFSSVCVIQVIYW